MLLTAVSVSLVLHMINFYAWRCLDHSEAVASFCKRCSCRSLSNSCCAASAHAAWQEWTMASGLDQRRKDHAHLSVAVAFLR